MMKVLKRKEGNWRLRYKLIEISCYIFMAVVILGYWNHANAGDVHWSIQLQFPAQQHRHYPGCGHGHNDHYHGGSIGTGPRTHTYHNGHWHLDHYHYYDGRYGWHYHNGRRYNVVHEFHNYHGEYCREFQMEVNIGGRIELAWGEACRDYHGHWRMSR